MVCPHEGGMSTQHAVDSGLAATTEAVDSLSEPMLETAQDLGRPLTQGRSARVNHKKQFSLLGVRGDGADRKSTRLNSSHGYNSYAVFCLKKKKKKSDS